MKTRKFVSLILVIAICFAVAAAAVACKKSDSDTPTVTAIKAAFAEDTAYVVGDAFDTSDITVTAILSNKEERKVTTTAAIEYDLDSLGLDDKGKFTQAKEYTLNIAFAGVKTTLTFTVAEA